MSNASEELARGPLYSVDDDLRLFFTVKESCSHRFDLVKRFRKSGQRSILLYNYDYNISTLSGSFSPFSLPLKNVTLICITG